MNVYAGLRAKRKYTYCVYHVKPWSSVSNTSLVKSPGALVHTCVVFRVSSVESDMLE